MTRVALKPGPPRTSCFTCRRRRKKCDMTKPSCGTCLIGGFECLGYQNPLLRIRRKPPTHHTLPQLKPLPSITSVQKIAETPAPYTLPSQTSEKQPTSITNDTDCDFRPSTLGTALLCRISELTPLVNNTHSTSESQSTENFNRLWPQDKMLLSVYSRASSRETSTTKTTSIHTSRTIESLCQSIPPSVDIAQTMRENRLLRVIDAFRFQRINYWFITPPPATRDFIATKVIISKKIRLILPLGATLFFQTVGLSTQAHDSTIREHGDWAENVEKKVTSSSYDSLSLTEVADQLMVELEVAFFRFALADSVSGYRLLRKSLPRALQLIALDSSLYMEQSNNNLAVSFSRALTSPMFELKRFVVYDTVSSLLLAVPPLLDYGYDQELDSEFDWIRGVPVAIAEAISQINSWRAGSRGTPDSWEALEKRVLAWKTPTLRSEMSTIENTRVTKMAVLESWRDIALIYIYMGMGGISSHDPRVQAAVHRIVQLGETVSNSPIGAGLAARLEKHRIVIYERLMLLKDTRVWLFYGPQMNQILRHLWHGVGAEGAPVTWDDYVQSRSPESAASGVTHFRQNTPATILFYPTILPLK
ncbi:fungal zn(2)-Cys(6) binuclear cluster domain-containing protein [Rhizoctonia solani AG-1 IA]|uniref:Fungal zn(2)-Cys(6) binuclear cluster domain-containing protein n=1 Tax=Thanatephorus cucumeris (strain AG1-IA) TaxID=983506 RepID=L8WL41_THACA|nr:fungal zn(2)-Cys(6) binuclear cluster domain-containing protein [Rhizoctonia solani AG-1 IA]